MAVRLARDPSLAVRAPVEPSTRQALRPLRQSTTAHNTNSQSQAGGVKRVAAATCTVVDDSPVAAPAPSATAAARARVAPTTLASRQQARAAPAPARPEPAACVDDGASASSSETSIEDIDIGDHDLPQQVSEYVCEIYEYLTHLQNKHRIDPNYLNQSDISPSMRELLIGWMSEVSIEFQLMNETHFLAVTIVDQFLSKHQVARDKLQLVGMSAMFLASKYEEIYHPPIEDFVYVSAKTYDREEMVAMELLMLRTLQFDLSFVTPLQFLRRYSKAASSEPRMHACCKYFLELALPKYAMLAYSASMIAASAVYLSRMLAGKKPVWNDTLAHYTKFTERSLMPCVKAFISILRAEAQAENMSAVSEKFSAKEYFRVSTSVLGYYRKY